MITQATLKKILQYDSKTGIFTWKISPSINRKEGSVAGRKTNFGYTSIKYKSKGYLAHRLAWLYMYGSFPNHQIDHINGVRDDNRIENLRDVPQSQNMKNTRKRVDNSSGITGVCWAKKDAKWMAQIKANGRSKFLGTFTDFFEACCIRKSAENKYGYHINHGKKPTQ